MQTPQPKSQTEEMIKSKGQYVRIIIHRRLCDELGIFTHLCQTYIGKENKALQADEKVVFCIYTHIFHVF